MKKIFLTFILATFLINFIAATDVAYVVNQPWGAKPSIIENIEEGGLTYKLILSKDIRDTDFSEYGLILINDEYFVDWAEIPVNEHPSLIINTWHISQWGWTKSVTSASQNTPMKVNIDCSHALCQGFSGLVSIYTQTSPNIYYLDKNDIYDGLTIVASTIYAPEDAVIAIAEPGMTLTKSGEESTEINAKTVFFGIYDSQYWTEDTTQIFQNSLIWLLDGQSSIIRRFQFSLKQGQNLVSFPLTLDSAEIDKILSNSRIESIKTYSNGNFITPTQIQNNKAYFINAKEDFTLSIRGTSSETNTVILAEGMNFVGVSSAENILLSSLPVEVIEVSLRNQDGTYNITTRYGTSWYNAFDLEPGKGYWFKTNKEVTWNYSS
jgi:hypothetical protein